MAAYTSPERVERNGYLIAFAGETMTETEARKRGLLGGASDEAEGDTGKQDDGDKKEAKPLDKKQVMAELESRDIKYNKRAKLDDLRALLDEAIKAEAEANGNDGDTGGEGEGGNEAPDANNGNDGDTGGETE